MQNTHQHDNKPTSSDELSLNDSAQVESSGSEASNNSQSVPGNSDRQLLAALEDISKKCLLKVLNRCLDSADDALFEQSEKSENSTVQGSFFGTMRDIRMRRQSIVEGFTGAVANSFRSSGDSTDKTTELTTTDSLELSLMADEDLELSVAVDSIVGKCQRQFAILLPSLNARFAAAKSGITRGSSTTGMAARNENADIDFDSMDANPVSPEKICDAFAESIDLLEADIPVLIVIYKLFERALLEDVGTLYEALNAKLLQARVLVNYTPVNATKEECQKISEQEQNAADNADKLVDQAISNSAAAGEVSSTSQAAATFASIANAAGISPVSQFFAGNLTPQSFPGMDVSPTEIQLANEMAQLLVYLPKLGQVAGRSENTQRIGQTVDDIAVSDQPAIGYDALLHLLNKLQREQVAEPADSEQQQSDSDEELAPHTVLQNLSNEIEAASSGNDHSIGYSERDTIGLVSMLFQFIIDDRVVSDVMRRTLGRLQLPIIKVALKDPRFFSNSSHPARIFLNKITSASVAWTESDSYERDPFYKKIVEFVDYIVDEFNDDLGIFDELTQNLEQFVEEDTARVEKSKQRLLDAELGKDRTEAVRKATDDLIASKATSANPDFVNKMLGDHYRNYLMRCALQEGPGSETYKAAAEIIDKMLWTINDSRSKADYSEILAEIPAIVRGIKISYESMNIDHKRSVPFFKQLAALHKTILQREAPVASELPTEVPGLDLGDPFDDFSSSISGTSDSEDVSQDLSSPDFSEGEAPEESCVSSTLPKYDHLDELLPETTSDNNSATQLPQYDAADELLPECSGADETDEGDKLEAECIEKAHRLAVGQWVEVAEDEETLRCRLAAILRASGKRVFVNRRGVKAMDMHFDELVEKIKSETLTLLDDNKLFDKALSSVIGDLRQQRRETLAC